jgi:hypothetical protein
MKKIVLLSALLIAGISINAQTRAAAKPAETQQAQDPATKATAQTARLDQAVILTAAQKEKAYAINLDKNKQMSAAAGNKATFEAEKARIKQEREKELSAILTPEQQTKFKTAKEEQTGKK